MQSVDGSVERKPSVFSLNMKTNIRERKRDQTEKKSSTREGVG